MELDLTEILNDWGGCADDMKSTLGYVFFLLAQVYFHGCQRSNN